MNIRQIMQNYEKIAKLHIKKHEKLFSKLAKEGQHPKTLFIGCSDSRVVPNIITGAKPGELFVFRNIGNFVPPFKPDKEFHATAAAIEYAVSVLKVHDIIVCGHSQCGAIESLFKDIPDSLELIHTKKWLELGKGAKEAVEKLGFSTKEEKLRAAEKLSILLQLENLLSYPAVEEKAKKEELFLHGWYFDMNRAVVEYFDEEVQDFIPLA